MNMSMSRNVEVVSIVLVAWILFERLIYLPCIASQDRFRFSIYLYTCELLWMIGLVLEALCTGNSPLYE